MQIGETVAVTVLMQQQNKCVICGKKHADAKKEKMKTTAPGKSGWHRKTMTGIFESDGVRETIYESGFPPSYEYQGHHALALSALVRDANTDSPKDKRLRLNYFLDKVGFFPNRPRNVIGLPARKGLGDFKAFWKSVDGDHPLQMHGPGHDEAYFNQCEVLIGRLVLLMTSVCEGMDKPDWEDLLKDTTEKAENYAFKKLAHYDSGWRLHPAEQAAAARLYSAPKSTVETISGERSSTDVKGNAKPPKAIKYPNPKLDTGPF
jgi:hypothetical protein